MKPTDYIRVFNPNQDRIGKLVGVTATSLPVKSKQFVNSDDYFNDRRFYIGRIVNYLDGNVYIDFEEDIKGSDLDGLAKKSHGWIVPERLVFGLSKYFDWSTYKSEDSLPKKVEDENGIGFYYTSPLQIQNLPSGTRVLVNGNNLGLNDNKNYLGSLTYGFDGVQKWIAIDFDLDVNGPEENGRRTAVRTKYVQVVDSVFDVLAENFSTSKEDAVTEEGVSPITTTSVNDVLSNWYNANRQKIIRLSPEKKEAVENAYLFFAKRYAKPEPVITQIEEDDFSFLENFDPETALVSEIEEFDLENLEL